MGSFLYSQSLVELAKKEKERRENLKNKKSQVITNAHLNKVKKGEAIEIPPAEIKEENEENEENNKNASSPPPLINTPTVIRADQNVSRIEEPAGPDSLENLETKWKKAGEMVGLLNLKMNALYQKYYNGDELTSRQKIEKEIAETYQQLLEAQKEADKTKEEYDRAKTAAAKKKK